MGHFQTNLFYLKVKLKLYSKSHDISKDFGSLHLIIRSIAATLIAFALMVLFAGTRFIVFPIVALMFGFVFVADKYGPRLYSDWPKRKYMKGEVTFETTRIHILLGEEREFDLAEVSEMVFFFDHYLDWSLGPRDVNRNGNGLLFIKMKDSTTEFFKFNIRTKEEFQGLEALIESYLLHVPFVLKKKVTDIPYILTSDLSERRVYH